MRLYNIYYLCKNSIETFRVDRIEEQNTSPKTYRIKNWNEYKNALETLSQISFFKQICEETYNIVPYFERKYDHPDINETLKGLYINNNSKIIEQILTIIKLCESMDLPDTSKGIDVKIPNCKDLKEYIKYLNDLDFIFTQCPYLLHKDETIKFSSVDVGSNWVNFIIENSINATILFYILNNLATIIDKVMILKSHFTSLKQQEETLKIAKQKDELAKDEKEIFNILKKYYMNEIVVSLENEISPLEDGEQRGRLEKSLEKLMNLLDKGVEIYASLDAPKDIQILFPTLDTQEKIPETVLQYLEDKNKKNSDE